MGILWPRSSSLEWDANGILADGALAYFYEAGTTTPKAVYQDGDETIAHEFPVEADAGRWPAVFVPFGTYKFVIKTAGGTTLFSADDVPNPSPIPVDFELDPDTVLTTGDIFLSLKNGTRSGAVRLNGRTIGDASSSATERANDDTEDLFAYLWNNVANGQAAVSGGRGANAAADFAAHKTIAVPDWRGASVVGLDDMGNSAASLLGTAPVVSGSGILAGSILGANTHTITEAQLAAHTHSFSATTGSDGAHTHTLSATTGTESADHGHTGSTSDSGTHTHTTGAVGTGSIGNDTSGGNSPVGNGTDVTGAGGSHTHTFTTAGVSATHTHSVSGTTSSNGAHTHTVSGTSGSTGSGTAHNILSRAGVVTYFIKL